MRVSAPRSLNTRAVIPTLVAARAVPRKSAVLLDSPQAKPTPMPARHRDDDADTRDRERRSPDGAQIGDAQLEADLEQQQDHPELGEDLERLAVVPTSPKHGRADDDAGDDLRRSPAGMPMRSAISAAIFAASSTTTMSTQDVGDVHDAWLLAWSTATRCMR